MTDIKLPWKEVTTFEISYKYYTATIVQIKDGYTKATITRYLESFDYTDTVYFKLYKEINMKPDKLKKLLEQELRKMLEL